MTDPHSQYRAFLALLIATLVIALAPIAVSGILGKVLPDALIATSDKAVTGFVTLLGTVGGLLFRQSRSDEQATANTGAAFAAIKAAQEAPAPLGPNAAQAADVVADAAVDAADQVKGNQ